MEPAGCDPPRATLGDRPPCSGCSALLAPRAGRSRHREHAHVGRGEFVPAARRGLSREEGDVGGRPRAGFARRWDRARSRVPHDSGPRAPPRLGRREREHAGLRPRAADSLARPPGARLAERLAAPRALLRHRHDAALGDLRLRCAHAVGAPLLLLRDTVRRTDHRRTHPAERRRADPAALRASHAAPRLGRSARRADDDRPRLRPALDRARASGSRSRFAARARRADVVRNDARPRRPPRHAALDARLACRR